MSIKLNGSTSGSVELDVPAAVSGGDISLTLPTSAGSAGQYLRNSATPGTLEFANGGKIVQVVSTTKTDTFSTTSTSFIDVTGLSVSITPSSTSNKILVFGHVAFNNTGGLYLAAFKLVRGSTDISIADAAGNRTRATTGSETYYDSTDSTIYGPFNFLDSPSTTSSTTYKLQCRSESPQTLYVNRGNESGGDSAIVARFVSTITAMEVAG